MKLSAKEQRELEYRRRVYQLAKQRKATEDALQQRDEYHLPDSYDAAGPRSQRYEVLTARYRCAARLRAAAGCAWKPGEAVCSICSGARLCVPECEREAKRGSCFD